MTNPNQLAAADADAARRRPGRPPIGAPTPVRLADEMRDQVDQWAADHGGLRRAEAIRRLVALALDADDHERGNPQ